MANYLKIKVFYRAIRDGYCLLTIEKQFVSLWLTICFFMVINVGTSSFMQ